MADSGTDIETGETEKFEVARNLDSIIDGLPDDVKAEYALIRDRSFGLNNEFVSLERVQRLFDIACAKGHLNQADSTVLDRDLGRKYIRIKQCPAEL